MRPFRTPAFAANMLEEWQIAAWFRGRNYALWDKSARRSKAATGAPPACSAPGR